jgi:PAS domain S-box-containing protein
VRLGEKLGVLLEKTDQQKRMYETALSNTADFNYVFNLEGRFVFVNKSLLDLWHKTLDQALGKNFFELDYPHELAQRLQDQIQEVIRSKEPIKDETPYTSPDGTLIYEYIFKPVIGADGKVEAVAGSTRDITEYKEANRRKDEFLAMLAHELRNPLAPISNAMHIMKSTSVSEKIKEEAALLVDRQITQMTHLLNDLLDVSRVTLGKIELRPAKVALSEIVNMAIESIQPLIDERKQKLVVNIPKKAIWLNADRTRMSQVFSNLLNNSAKYTRWEGR